MNKIILGALFYASYIAWRRMQLRHRINYNVIEKFIYRLDDKIKSSDTTAPTTVKHAQLEFEAICWRLSNINADVVKCAANEYADQINEIFIIPMIAIATNYLHDIDGYRTIPSVLGQIEKVFGYTNSKVYSVLTKCGFSLDEIKDMHLLIKCLIANLEQDSPSITVLPCIKNLIHTLINKISPYIPM